MPIDSEPRQFIDRAGLETFWADVQTFLTRNYKTLPAGMQFSQIYQLNGQLHILVEPFGGSTTQRKEASRTSLDVYSKDEVDAAIRDNGGYIGQKTLYELNNMPHEPHNGDSVNVKFGPNDSEYIDPVTGFGRIYNMWDGVQDHSYIEVLDGDNIIYDRRALTHVWDRQTGNYKIRQVPVSVSMDTYETVLDISQDDNGNITVHKKTIPTAAVGQLGLTTLKGSIGTAETDNGTAATPKAVRDAIDAAIDDLDVAEIEFGPVDTVGTIEEVDGKIVVTPVEIRTATTEVSGITTLNSATVSGGTLSSDETMAVTALGVKNAIESLDVTEVAFGPVQTMGTIEEIDGKIVVTPQNIRPATTEVSGITTLTSDTAESGEIVETENRAVTPLGVKNAIGTLDVGATTLQASETISSISETDGKISVSTQAILAGEANIDTGAVTEGKIGAGAVTETKIGAGAVTETKIGTGAVTNTKLGDNSVSTGKIADGAVTTGKLGDKAVTTAKIDDGAVTTGQIGAKAVTTAKIDDGAVNTDQLGDSAVATGKIANGAVTTEKLDASGGIDGAVLKDRSVEGIKIAEATITGSSWDEEAQAVHVSNIKPGTISGREIATGNNDGINTANIVDHAITSDKLATDSVNTAHIIDAAVTTDKLYDGAVTTGKIGTQAVTAEKLATDSVTTTKILNGAVTTDKLEAQAVTTAKIADLNVTTGKIADDAVTTVKIADGNVTTAKIADGNVTEGKLGTDSVTTAKIKDENVTESKLATDSVTTDKIKDGNVTGGKLADGAVTTAKIDANAITPAKVSNDTYEISISGTAKYATHASGDLATELNGKADKVTGATSGNLAGLDASGNLTDSGVNPSNIKTKQTAVDDPTASGNAYSFIDTLSQDANGEVTVTKKTVPDATTAVRGVSQLNSSTVITANDSSSLSDDETKAVTALGVKNAIDNLDSGDSKVETKVVRAVNVTNGKIAVTKDTLGISDIDQLGTRLGNIENGKADKVANATSGNFASLDSNGNLVDSGSKAADFVQMADLQELDLAEIGGTGYYISTISQTDGQLAATAVQMDTSPTANSKNAVTSDGVYSAISGAVNALDVSDSAVSHQFVTAVPEADGKVSVSRAQPVIADVDGLQTELNSKQNTLTFEDTYGDYNPDTNPVPTVASITSRLGALDLASQGGADGNYISQIKQTDGQVEVTVSSTINDLDTTTKAPVNSGAVKSAITGAIAALDKTDISGFGADKTLATLSETDGIISATFQDIKVGTDNINDSAVTSAKIAQDAVTTTKIADDAVTAAKVKDNELLPVSITGNAATASKAQTGSDLESAIGAKEDKSNKVQSMNSSSTGLTTEYPSAQAVVDFVNSSVATNTANFLGNKDVVNDLHLTTSATNAQISTALGNYVWPSGTTPTNNDYVFVTVDDLTTTGVDEYRRFKYDGSSWQYEYTLNNSSFTQAQWNAINSGLSATDKTNYDNHLADTVIHVTAADKANWNGKADKTTTVTNVAYDTTGKKLTKTVNGTTSDVVSVSTLKTDMSLDQVDNTSDLAKPISTATQSALDLKEDKANKVTAWSSTTSDTNYPSEKLVKGSLDNKVDKVTGKGLSTNDYTTAEKNKLAGIESDAEVNQNAFSSVTVGTDTIQADTKTDTLTLVAGNNVQLAADTATDTVTISATDTTYGADRGISLVSGKFGHSNAAVTGASVGPSDAVTGVSVSVPRFTFDGYGHVTAASDKTFTVRSGSTSQTGVVRLQGSIGATESEDGKAATPKAVRDAINSLDVASVGGSGNVIVSISEEDGKISATAGKLSASGGALSYSGEIDEDFCLTLSNVVFAD